MARASRSHDLKAKAARSGAFKRPTRCGIVSGRTLSWSLTIFTQPCFPTRKAALRAVCSWFAVDNCEAWQALDQRLFDGAPREEYTPAELAMLAEVGYIIPTRAEMESGERARTGEGVFLS